MSCPKPTTSVWVFFSLGSLYYQIKEKHRKQVHTSKNNFVLLSGPPDVTLFNLPNSQIYPKYNVHKKYGLLD